MYKNALNIGTLAGIIAFTLFLLLYYIGLSPLSVPRFGGIPIPVIAIIWAILKTRNQVLGGNITFAQGFMIGSVTTMVWATFKGFCIYIFLIAFDQHVIEQYLQFTRDYFAFIDSISTTDYSSMVDMEQIEKEATPMSIMTNDIFLNIFFGSGISGMAAIILRRVPK